jgi:steroid delta-isomerase-like uncharacterized protein
METTTRIERATAVLAAIDANDFDAIRASYAPDCELVGPGVVLRSPDEVVGWVKVFTDAFPDLRHEVLAAIDDGETAVAEIRASGTHTAPMASPDGDIPPTGKRFQVDYVDVWRFRDGRIVSDHVYFDLYAFLTQLGLLAG